MYCSECTSSELCTNCVKGNLLVDDGVCVPDPNASTSSTTDEENHVELEFVENGVLRKDQNSCDIVFTNFGMDKHIKELNVFKISKYNTDRFNLRIENLVNGNIGPNNKIHIDPEELKEAIKIKQNNNSITNFEVIHVFKDTGLMDIEIKDLMTCENLSIKQTFIEPFIKVAGRTYYEDTFPININQPFNAKKFGPSYSYPLDQLYWKYNDGLDDLIKTCGVYIHYTSLSPLNGAHWQYYLSTENANTKNCTQFDFYNVLKRNYLNYDFNHFTDHISSISYALRVNYTGYVLKREGHIEEHMDGIIPDQSHLIEIYMEKCSNVTQSRIVCNIPSDHALSYTEFTEELQKCEWLFTHNMEWTLNNGIITGTNSAGVATVTTTDIDSLGSLPETTDGDIIYSNATDVSVARFLISYNCNDYSNSYNSGYINFNWEHRCVCMSNYYFFLYYFLTINNLKYIC